MSDLISKALRLSHRLAIMQLR